VKVLFTNRGLPLLLAVCLAVVVQRSPVRAAVQDTDISKGVCDPIADYYLGMEDYPQAIRLHLEVIRKEPGNALAHYHLGFAYGAIGDHQRELVQYEKAIALGLNDWQLFLNLGLLYANDGRIDSAIEVMRLAELLGPYHPETHFNLGLLDERVGLYQPAEQEMLLSLRLSPDQIDVRNQLGVIYAEEGNYRRAREEWNDLLMSDPAYLPARANLDLLGKLERGRVKHAKELSSFTHAP
jgi:tetratricopeptide (TPR) repeat protein